MFVSYYILLAMLFSLIGYLLGNILFGEIIIFFTKNDLRKIGSGNVGSTNVTRAIGLWAGIITFVWDCFKSWIAIFFSYLIYLYILVSFNTINILENAYIIYIAGFFTVIGHCFPIKYFIALIKNNFDFTKAAKAKGGKGAASTAGFILAVSPWVFLICFITWWIIVLITRLVSLATLIGVSLAIILLLIPNINYFYFLEIPINNLSVTNLNGIINNFFDPLINYNNHWAYYLFCEVLYVLVVIVVFIKHKENIKRLIKKSENKIF